MLIKQFLNKKGFSLIELILVITIIGLVITSVGNYFVSNLRNYNADRDQLEAQNNIAAVMKEFVETAMETQTITAVVLPGPQSITFQDSAGISSQYTLNGSDLQLSINGNPATTIASNISTVQILPYQVSASNGPPLLIPSIQPPLSTDYTDLVGDAEDDDTCGVQITITSTVNTQSVTLINSLFFRNR